MDILLPDNACIFYGKSETQHDEICVCSIEAVGIVIVKLLPIPSHELHNLMFSLSWRI